VAPEDGNQFTSETSPSDPNLNPVTYNASPLNDKKSVNSPNIVIIGYYFHHEVYHTQDCETEVLRVIEVKGKVHPYTGTEVLYRPYGP